jgi:hypothetical protein
MTSIPLKKNFGGAISSISPDLARILDEMYTDFANAINEKRKTLVLDGSNPPASAQINEGFSLGDTAIRQDTNTAWILTSRTTPQAVVWTAI